MTNETRAIETPECIHCGDFSIMFVAADALAAYDKGALLQDAFPMFTAAEREQLLTGIHPACWLAIFPPEDEE